MTKNKVQPSEILEEIPEGKIQEEIEREAFLKKKRELEEQEKALFEKEQELEDRRGLEERERKLAKRQKLLEQKERELEEYKKSHPIDIDELPLETFRDYKKYNEEARKINKRLKILRYKIKQCPEELHPKQRIEFGRIDQPENSIPVHLSNHLIHYDKTLYPGQVYDLPVCVINHLAEKGYPVWKWVDTKGGKPGERETVISHKKPRFSLRTIYNEDEVA